jgi:RNA polymerase sigma-70 factor (TIGR02960 family)
VTVVALEDRLRAGEEQAFRELAGRFGGELHAHCYRILGSVQDAEDMVQETLVAAWRGIDGFKGRSSLRTWLYRIATNRCLNALRARGRRVPEVPPPPEQPPEPPRPTREREAIWLEPYPDSMLRGDVVDPGQAPETRYERREAIGLAFVAALQYLPPRQRAVLVLRDVLGFRAREVAEMLETTEASVNGALRRARTGLEREVPDTGLETAPLPDSAAERELVARFASAFESGDIEAIVAVLTEDAALTMPPEPLEYRGPGAIAAFLTTVPAGGALERIRLIPVRANGQPAFGCYLRDPHAPVARAYGLMVLTLSGDRVAAITGFPGTGVFPHFGLPRTIREQEMEPRRS